MLVDNSVYRNSYVANGSTTKFAISFPFLDNAHIIVYKNVNGTESVVNSSEYTITGAGQQNGGTLTFGSAPSSGTIIVIARNVPITQLHKYTELDNFPAESHEDALAKLTMIDQQQQDSINRAIKLAETDTRTPDELLNEIFTAKDVAVACATESCQCADNADTSRNEALQFRNEAQNILNNTTSEGQNAVANVRAQEASSIQAVKGQEAASAAVVEAEGDTQAVRLVDLASNILVSGTAYNKEVTADVTVETPAETYITLPVDSKGDQLMYRVGAAMIRMSYNGAQMYVGDQFDEVGIAGSISTQIKVNFDLEVGSRLNFFIIAQNVTVIVDQESGLAVDEQNRLTAKPLKDSTVRTVNDNAPDSTGNITPEQTGCLPRSGGTMTGAINSDNIDQIKITNANVSIGDTSRSSELYNKPITVLDKNGKRGGAVEISWYTDGSRSFGFSMRGREDSGYIFCGAREWPNGYVSFECNDSLVFLPSGAVFAFAANSAPAGCLLCNGAEVSRTTYAKLFEAIGTTYGKGNGSTTFNLPNLTDKFIQGSGTAGTVKSAGLPNITGTTSSYDWIDNNAMSGAFKASSLYDQKYAGTSTSRSANNNFDASRCSSIYGKSTTVQPPALTMRYYIKY